MVDENLTNMKKQATRRPPAPKIAQHVPRGFPLDVAVLRQGFLRHLPQQAQQQGAPLGVQASVSPAPAARNPSSGWMGEGEKKGGDNQLRLSLVLNRAQTPLKGGDNHCKERAS